MKRYDRNRPHSSVYRKLWEKYHKASLLPGIHIHHLDKDPFNNSKENLFACTAEEHWKLHLDAGDSVAINGKFIQYASHSKENHYRWNSEVPDITKERISNTVKNYHKKDGVRIKHSRERGGKSIYVWKVNGTFIGKYDTQIEAAEALNINKCNINQCLSKQKNSVSGYVINNIEVFPIEQAKRSKQRISKSIRAYNLVTMNLIGEYTSILACSKNLNVSREQIKWYLKYGMKASTKHSYHFERTL